MMTINLANLGYVFDPIANIWMRSDYPGIQYNDGDEVENRIAAVIKEASDLSVLSTELRQYCIDWPSLYHLTGTRANIMRPFEAIYKNARVLEIGAGCGAITRYLGESGANVLALEGSPRRAAIARSRTRDLDNVTVLAEKFDQFKCAEKFDVVTLIGVLEYANLFTPGDNPALSMLERVRQLLKPEGKLIIAIENQLGLKYFAGAPEDHLGTPMVGIEGRYRKDQPQTYGRKKLQSLLHSAKFTNSSFLAPFPDYKLPVSIVTEAGFNNKNFDASALVWQGVKRDPQLPQRANFSLELAWPQLFENDLALDVSNSFLIIASGNAEKLIPEEALAFHFSTDRVEKYCKSTVFAVNEFKDIYARYTQLKTKSAALQPLVKLPVLEFVCPESDKYVFGKTLSLEFVKLVTHDGWRLEDVGHYFSRYFEIIKELLARESIHVTTFDKNFAIPASYFDAIPHNIIIDDKKSITLIDNEWKYSGSLNAGYLLFRALLWSSFSITRFGKPAVALEITNFELMQRAFFALGWEFEEADYQRYSAQESRVQELVSGRSVGTFYKTWINALLPVLSLKDWSTSLEGQLLSTQESLSVASFNLSSTERRLLDADTRLIDTETRLADKFYEMGLKDAQIKDQDRQIIDLHSRITAMQLSSSWRLTRPVRFASRQMKRVPLFMGLIAPAIQQNGGFAKTASRLASTFRHEGVSGVRQYLRTVALSKQSEQQDASVKKISTPRPNRFVAPLIDNFTPLSENVIAHEAAVKMICFYLPQYHAIAENNVWWGDGFTEWTNVKPAQPQYLGHYQPHQPGELGYYNLLDPSVQQRQVELAKLYDIGGFCFYFYWFGGKLLLEKPTENYLANSTLDLPFCLCWANENWSRRWDGLDHEILIQQNHSAEDDIAFIRHISKYLRDPRYIKVQNKPLVLVYRPKLLPSAKETALRWREWCLANGIGEIYLAYTQSFESADPADYGFDAAVEFPPNNSSPPNITETIVEKAADFTGNIYDWQVFVERSERYVKPAYVLHRSVCPAWDNTARRKSNSTVFANHSPALFQKWTENAIDYTVNTFASKDERLVFVNAWNEWGEGAHLEPDDKYGYGHLRAIRNAQISQSKKTLNAGHLKQQKIALIIHAYYVDIFEEIIQSIDASVKSMVDIFITCEEKNEAHIQNILTQYAIGAIVQTVQNHGRDMLPFLKILPQVVNSGASLVIKVHTKKSTHRVDGDVWRKGLLGALLTTASIHQALTMFQEDAHLGVIGPAGNVVPMDTYWGSNQHSTLKLASRLGIDLEDIHHLTFVAGSMFMARLTALLPLLGLELRDEEFEAEAGQVDGTMAHAIERAISISAHRQGLTVAAIDKTVTTEFAYANKL
jgi:lipopolysaccharide biosynthesis protein/2-polyprenyl-3-methyl-5-hydroxy-6-metoxy-1,4-benzoquinol methylase